MLHTQHLASQLSTSHEAVAPEARTAERHSLLRTVQQLDLAIKQDVQLAAHALCVTAQHGTQQQTVGVQPASQAQLGASAAVLHPCAAPAAADAALAASPVNCQELAANAARQQQALVQLINLELAAGAVVPACLIQELGAVAAIQQGAADAHIRQLAGGACLQQAAAAVLVAELEARAQRLAADAAEQRQAADDRQEQLILDVGRARSERAQARGQLASAQSERDAARSERDAALARVQTLQSELDAALAVPVIDPEVRGVATAALMVQ